MLFLAATFAANPCLAIDSGSTKDSEDIPAISTGELEKRLESVNEEIEELKVEAEYLRTEPPDFGVSSPAVAEKTGFYMDKEREESKLLNPRASDVTKKRLSSLERLKEEVEKELDRRYQENR